MGGLAEKKDVHIQIKTVLVVPNSGNGLQNSDEDHLSE